MQALNYPLQQLILNWAARRQDCAGRLQAGASGQTLAADGCSPNSNLPPADLESNQGNTAEQWVKAPVKQVRNAAARVMRDTLHPCRHPRCRLRRRHEQVGLRLRVLRNELLDVIGEQEVRQHGDSSLLAPCAA
jgi:hypothetical protein